MESLLVNFKYLQVTLNTPKGNNYQFNQFFLSKTKTLIINLTKAFYDRTESELLLHIRCLILGQSICKQFKSIQLSNFPYLERLKSINLRLVYETAKLYQLIFSNKFRYLYSCSLPRTSYGINNRWTCSLNLRSFQINILDILVYIQILDACPQLIHLKIEVTRRTNEEKPLVINPNKNHSSLRRLGLCCSNSATCNFIDIILSFVPSLE
ncbi:unnamed protein product [Rotaria socialis]|uniref:Uncharacterized protein n=1 Tax=Rotaria socialis TaxID=392032 RepID=A0A817YTP0_9BILA|nr:unnamed protein product [Rotaria socialis]CAF3437159.1 unnamed protein product [Rotaria socialis]CAF4236884.1 unnamed protein product [Rotaria socialis]CAF4314238.1 unnamed protein product [Rotaria socialis]